MTPVSVEINVQYLLDNLRKLITLPAIQEKIEAVKEAGNIFAWVIAVAEVAATAIKTVEKIVIDVSEVGHGSEKRDAVVRFLDEVIEFRGLVGKFIEQFDSTIFGYLVDFIVSLLNKGWASDEQ